jgi:hypothetical protein
MVHSARLVLPGQRLFRGYDDIIRPRQAKSQRSLRIRGGGSDLGKKTNPQAPRPCSRFSEKVFYFTVNIFLEKRRMLVDALDCLFSGGGTTDEEFVFPRGG